MRGAATFTESLFSVRRLDYFVITNDPLRPVREMVNEAWRATELQLSAMYADNYKGRPPSITPERMLMEQTQHNLLFRWFIGLSTDNAVWVSTVFTKKLERLIAHDAVIELFNAVQATAQKMKWLSGEHFNVDSALIPARAGRKSFRAKEGTASSNQGGDVKDDGDGQDTGPGNFKGQRRNNCSRKPCRDADARLYRKGSTASKLRFRGKTLSDNRHGRIANTMVTTADGSAEREAAKVMVVDARQVAAPHGCMTLGARKGYDAQEFIKLLTQMKGQSHAAQNTSDRRSAVSRQRGRDLGLCRPATKAQAHRARPWLGQFDRAGPPGHGAWVDESRPTVRTDHGRLKPHAYAHLGANPPARAMSGRNEAPKSRSTSKVFPQSA